MPQTFVINLLYDMHIQHGDSSHTRGISAAWPTEDSKFKAVILDTAGTNQPVNQSHCDDRQCVDREIRQRQVIDNFVVDIADAASAATLYVLNRMTTTDAVRDGGAAAWHASPTHHVACSAVQERVNNLIHNYLYGRGPMVEPSADALSSMHRRLIIVHNLKDLGTVADVQRAINLEVLTFRHAKQVPGALRYNSVAYKGANGVGRITHFVLVKNHTDAGRARNRATIAEMRQFLGSDTQAGAQSNYTLLDHIQQSITKVARRYLTGYVSVANLSRGPSRLVAARLYHQLVCVCAWCSVNGTRVDDLQLAFVSTTPEDTDSTKSTMMEYQDQWSGNGGAVGVIDRPANTTVRTEEEVTTISNRPPACASRDTKYTFNHPRLLSTPQPATVLQIDLPDPIAYTVSPQSHADSGLESQRDVVSRRPEGSHPTLECGTPTNAGTLDCWVQFGPADPAIAIHIAGQSGTDTMQSTVTLKGYVTKMRVTALWHTAVQYGTMLTDWV